METNQANYHLLVSMKQIEDKDLNTTAVETYQIEVETAALVRTMSRFFMNVVTESPFSFLTSGDPPPWS